MAPLNLDVKRVIRGYEPIFRSMLTRWLKAHLDATGESNPSVEDVSAGVAHVFSASEQGTEVRGGEPEKALEEYKNGKVYSWEEVLRVEFANEGGDHVITRFSGTVYTVTLR